MRTRTSWESHYPAYHLWVEFPGTYTEPRQSSLGRENGKNKPEAGDLVQGAVRTASLSQGVTGQVSSEP